MCRKILLIQPACIYGQRTNLIGLYLSGGGRWYIRDVNRVTYLEGVYLGGLYKGERINGILRYIKTHKQINM